MRVTVKGITKIATEAGLPESLIDRHIDALIHFAGVVSNRERKLCKNAIRAWYFDKNVAKVPLFEILDEEQNDLA
jgi:hypothetical protein